MLLKSSCSNSRWCNQLPLLGLLHHYHGEGEDYCFCQYYYYTFQKSFFDFHQTSQVGTLGGPYYTDPFWVTLTYFSRSQTHFSAEITKLKIVITFLFLAQFWSNFTGMDSRSTPSLWPSFGDLDLLLQVRLNIGVLIYYVKQVRVPFYCHNTADLVSLLKVIQSHEMVKPRDRLWRLHI